MNFETAPLHFSPAGRGRIASEARNPGEGEPPSRLRATATSPQRGEVKIPMPLPRERLAYSSPFTRPPLRLPGGARMAVWSVVNVEEWETTRPMARQLSQPPGGQQSVPDMPNWTWYEYGMRVGFWRLMRALAAAGVTPTMSVNAKVCETYPEVASAARDAGWEFMAHSYVQMPLHQIE